MIGWRLWLVGEDEALDILAELSRHLDYVSVARLDDLPDETLGAQDHLVIGRQTAHRSLELLALALGRGAPGVATVLADPAEGTPGARAISVAAELVAAQKK